MTGWRLALGVLLPFVALCAIALWLTRPSPPTAPAPPPPPASEGSRSAPPSPPPRRPLPSAAPRAAPTPATPAAPAPPEEPSRPAAAPPPAPEPQTSPAPSRPGVPPDEPTTISKEEVQAAIRGALPLVRECFEDAARRNPGPQRVVLKFTLEGQGLSGRMKDGEVMDSTLQDPWVQACFLDAIADAQFPAPRGRGAVTITYPFSFQPDPDGGTPAGR